MNTVFGSDSNIWLTVFDFEAVDDGLAASDLDGVHQGVALQVVVDQGGHDADLGHSQPGKKEESNLAQREINQKFN